MSIVVGQGSALIPTGTYPSSYAYQALIDTTSGSPAGESVTIATAPSSNSRIDTIVAYVNTSYAVGTTNNPGMLVLTAVEGTVAVSPSAPSNSTIQSAIGASNPYIKLANVTVGTNVTQITNGNISDQRTFVSLATPGVVAPNNLVASSGTTWVWQTFSPTFNLVSGGGSSWGNATFAGRYIQIGKTVHYYAQFTLGSTTNFSGLTSITMNLPVTASSTWAQNTPIGNIFTSAQGGFQFGVAVLVSTSTIKLWVEVASSTYVTASDVTPSAPAIWGNGNTLIVSGTYEAA